MSEVTLNDEMIRISDQLKQVIEDRNKNYVPVSELREWCEAEKIDDSFYDEIILLKDLLARFCKEGK